VPIRPDEKGRWPGPGIRLTDLAVLVDNDRDPGERSIRADRHDARARPAALR